MLQLSKMDMGSYAAPIRSLCPLIMPTMPNIGGNKLQSALFCQWVAARWRTLCDMHERIHEIFWVCPKTWKSRNNVEETQTDVVMARRNTRRETGSDGTEKGIWKGRGQFFTFIAFLSIRTFDTSSHNFKSWESMHPRGKRVCTMYCELAGPEQRQRSMTITCMSLSGQAYVLKAWKRFVSFFDRQFLQWLRICASWYGARGGRELQNMTQEQSSLDTSLAPDGGWGWVIMVASFFIHAIGKFVIDIIPCTYMSKNIR